MDFDYLKDLFDYTEVVDGNPLINYNTRLIPNEWKTITFKNCIIKKQIRITKSFTNDDLIINIGERYNYIIFDCFNNCYFADINNDYIYNPTTDKIMKVRYILLINDIYNFNNIVGEDGLFYIYKNNRIIKNVKANDKFNIIQHKINIKQCYCHENTMFYPDKTILADVYIDFINGNINTHYNVEQDLKIKFE